MLIYALHGKFCTHSQKEAVGVSHRSSIWKIHLSFQGCNWSFQNASKLSRHQRKHTNDRKFMCPICQKSFLRSEHLKSHLLIHTGVRNFQCPIERKLLDRKFFRLFTYSLYLYIYYYSVFHFYYL